MRVTASLFAFALMAAPALAQDAAVQPIPPRQDYTLAAMEIIGFDFLLNRLNRCCGSQRDDYDVSLASIRRNLRSSWVVDSDPFRTNQMGHPYQGSMYHGFARSAGLGYWESAGYAFAGSIGWELAGEQTPPSRNDQISSGVGGTFLGEALYRMSSLLLEKGAGLSPFWRETAAAAVSPSTGFNRLVMGRRSEVFSSRGAAYYSQAQIGFMGLTQNAAGTSTVGQRNEAQADFSLDYGMPGKEGYQYRQPFDHFSFRATLSSANGFENVLTRGLLFGREYGAGNAYRGVWGLYGSYDYIAPQTFRISSTALSLGTTGQWRVNETWALQGSAMSGLGYAAVGTINGVAAERDYRYGVAPQALLALRLIRGDRSSLDLTAREYFVTRVGGIGGRGHDNIARADIAYTWRLHEQHAVTIKYLWNRRDATYPGLGDRSQTHGTLGIFYTLLGHDHFGRVDWR